MQPTSTAPAEPRTLVHLGPRTTVPLALHGRGSWLRVEAAFAEAGLVDARLEISFRDGRRMRVRPLVTGRNAFSASLRIQGSIEALALHLEGSCNPIPVRASARLSGIASQARALGTVALARLVRDPRAFVGSAVWFLARAARDGAVAAPAPSEPGTPHDAYQRWIGLFDDRPEADAALYARQVGALSCRPLFSVLAVPGPTASADDVVAVMQAQIYPDWELLLPAGRSTPADPRVRLIPIEPGDRATVLTQLLAAARGAHCLMPGPSTRLRPHALLMAALALEAAPDAQILYADEDHLDAEGRRHSPLFKPAWSPEAAAVSDLLGDPVLVSTELARSVGGWRTGLDGAEHVDFKLRATEAVGPQAIVHLAKILAHRIDTSHARPAIPASVIDAHLARIRDEADAVPEPRSPYPRIVRRFPTDPLVTIVIPTRDRADLLDRCVTSLFERTQYGAIELIVADNGSSEPETHALFHRLQRDPRVRILPQPGPFNYAAINNAAVREGRGPILALLNNDIEILSGDWLREMVGYARHPAIGCVGAKLYYPGGPVQHAGVVTGLLGGAGHAFKHAGRGDAGYLSGLLSVRNVSAVTAACLVVRRSVYEEVGGFDEERFAIAFNDVDLCLKVAAAGYRNVWTPFAELIHHESISRGMDLADRAKARRFAAELGALQERWGDRLTGDPYWSPHLSLRSERPIPRTS